MADARVLRNMRSFIGNEGVIPRHLDLVKVGNVGVGEDDLISVSLAAGFFSKDGDGAKITAWGVKANNANAKTVKLHFGSGDLGGLALQASELGAWKLEAYVFRTAEDVQKGTLSIYDGPTDGSLVATIVETETDASAIVVKCTGTATADDDIEQEGLLVEKIGS